MSDERSGNHVPVDRRTRFERLYTESYPLILGYALRRCPAAEDAADVLAETFLTAWRRLDELPDPPQARLWLYGVARRVLANQRRGQRRAERLSARLRAAGMASVQAVDVSGVELASGIAAAFGRLPDADRELLALVAWEGLTSVEAARVVGCSAGAARVRLHRARSRFARELASEGIERVTGPTGADMGRRRSDPLGSGKESRDDRQA